MTKKKTKEKKVSPPKTKQKATQKKSSIQPKIIYGMMLFIILAALGLLAYFIVVKLLEPTNLASILPEEQTVGFVTVDIYDLAANGNLPADYMYSPESLESTVAMYLGQESFDIAQEWFGGQAAMAMLMGTNQETSSVYFLEYSNRALATDFLKSLTMPEEEIEKTNYQGTTIYSYPLGQNFSATFAGNYLVIAEEMSSLELIIDTASGDSSSLKSYSYYNKVADNLPYNATAITFWDIKKYPNIAESYIPIYEIVPESLISPVLAIFPAFGAAMQTSEDGLYVQTYTAVEKELLGGNSYFSFPDKYRANLAQYLPEGEAIFWGGHDLRRQTQRLLEIFNEFQESAGVIFEAVLRAKAQEYFGDNISLQYDIYPLLENEYALSVYIDEEGNKDYLCMLDLVSQDDKLIHIDTLKKGFLEQQIYSEPYVQTYTLEDGTTGKEIVADLAEILSSDLTYEDVDITMFYLSNEETLGYMTLFANTFAFSTDLDILKHSIDLMKGPDGSLSASEDMDAINAIMRSADEASYINLEDFRDSAMWGMNFFSGFSGISSTKNVFDDGVATFHLLIQ